MKVMHRTKISLTLSILAIAGFAFNTTTAEAKPLNVYILAGQSNMDGQAKLSTF